MTVLNDGGLRLPRPPRPMTPESRAKRLQASLCSLLAIGVAAGIAAEVASSWSQPLWADEVVTIQMTGAGSWSHLMDGVRLGLDATPPLYTGVGWLLVHLGLPIDRMADALRAFNAILVSASIASLYWIARRFLDRCNAIMAVAIFLLLDSGLIAMLCLELRTYALYFAATVAAVHTGLRLLDRPTAASRFAHAACLVLLACTHTIGIAFAACMCGSLAVVHLVWGDGRAAIRQVASAVPAALAFLAWLPVVRSQAGLGNWIDTPTLHDLFKASFIYPSSAACVAFGGVLVLFLSRHPGRAGAVRGALALSSACRRGLNRSRAFCILLAASFAALACMVWEASRLLFPIFVARYFTPNLLILFLIITVLIWSATIATRRLRLTGLLAVLVAIGLGMRLVLPEPIMESRIPCYDPARNRFFEDEVRGDLPVVSPYFHAWLTRLNREGEVSLYPSDTSPQADEPVSGKDFVHAFAVSYMRRFARWSPSPLFVTSDQLGRQASDFLVIDDEGKGGWLKAARSDPRFRFDLVKSEILSGETCRLWRVKPTRVEENAD